MTKDEALKLIAAAGKTLAGNVTFASRNASLKVYWANPQFDYLDNDWSLIINDTRGKQLRLFLIPAHSLAKTQLTPRSDQPDRIHLEIQCGDPFFTDRRSGVRFYPYLTDTIKY